MIYNKIKGVTTPHVQVFCHYSACGKLIPKRVKDSWRIYSKRKYCDKTCNLAALRSGSTYENETGFNMGKYIAHNSRNGRMMADFNLGVLRAVDKVKSDKSLVVGDKGVITSYKGVPVTGELVKVANNWLMEQWKGRPGQRLPEADTDDRTEDQKMHEFEYIVKELGYGLYKLGKFKVVAIDE